MTLAVPGYWDCVSELCWCSGNRSVDWAYSRKIEMQPMIVAFQAAKGCNLVLFELVDRLGEAGLIREVMSGKTALPL